MPANKSKKGYISCRKENWLNKQKKIAQALGLELGLQMKKKLNYNFWPEKFHNYENKTPLTKFKIVDVVKTISSSSFAKIPEKNQKLLA